MAVESTTAELVPLVILLGSAVVAVPLFKRVGLGSVLGYLAAGFVIGPFGLGFFTDPATILHVAELGVVMFLFLIGLEMQPARLWSMRRDIFGLGLTQVVVCTALLAWVGVALGYPMAQSLIAGAGFVLTSTAIVMQSLEERGEISTPEGGRIISILLLEDLAIVPLLALVAFLAPGGAEATLGERLVSVAIGLGSIGALLLAGRYLLDPMFEILARARAREVMTAAALLVVLGAALGLQLGGLSAAMGAFLAGVMLSDSSFRHQLEADVEPFRGILLGLFFVAVGMSVDLDVIAANWPVILASVVAFTALKAVAVYGIARAFRAPHREALERTALMTQGGEFAFVLYAAALAVGLIDAEGSAILSAIIILSMMMTPLFLIAHDRLMPKATPSADGLETPDGQSAAVLIIGFGRFGQIVAQPLLARGYAVTTIDMDPEMVRAANDYGYLVYYGDGTRLDILHAAGAGRARMVIVCVDDKAAATRIVHLMKDEFPVVPVFARAFDRGHQIELMDAGADDFVRETFHSALSFGGRALTRLGEDPDVVTALIEEVRLRDADRLALQISQGLRAGQDLLLSNRPAGAPGPRRSSLEATETEVAGASA